MMESMKCGHCGCDIAKLRAVKSQSLDAFARIEIQCVGCGGITVLRPVGAIQVDRSVDNDGSFCIGWNGEEESLLNKARRQVFQESLGDNMKVVGDMNDIQLTTAAELEAQQLRDRWQDEGRT